MSVRTRAARAALAVGATALVAGCASNYNWGWYVVSPMTKQGRTNLEFLLSGLGYTVSVAVIAMIVSMLIGLVIALLGMSKSKPARAVNRIYVEIFRAIPILVMVLWVYYGLPVILGINMGVFAAGVLSLALCDSAFEAEIFRGGIQSIDRGQHEAADTLGLTFADKMRFVILPQAIKRILPPLGNQFVYMLKMSSLISVIGLTELTRQANELVVTEYRPLEIYSFLVLEYLILILLVSKGVRSLEQRMRADELHPR